MSKTIRVKYDLSDGHCYAHPEGEVGIYFGERDDKTLNFVAVMKHHETENETKLAFSENGLKSFILAANDILNEAVIRKHRAMHPKPWRVRERVNKANQARKKQNYDTWQTTTITHADKGRLA